jgi:hypothetical protein
MFLHVGPGFVFGLAAVDHAQLRDAIVVGVASERLQGFPVERRGIGAEGGHEVRAELCRPPGGLRPARADPKRWMRGLHGLRSERHVLGLSEPTIEGDVVLGKEPLHQLDALDHTGRPLSAVQAKRIELVVGVALPYTQIEPSVGKDVREGDIFCGANGMNEGQDQDEGADPDPLRHGGHRRGHR